MPDICNCPPSSIAFAVGSFFFFFFCFLRLFLFCFLFCFQWAGPGVVRVVLHVDRVTSAIVNGYPFSSFSFCATWKRAKKKQNNWKTPLFLSVASPFCLGRCISTLTSGPVKWRDTDGSRRVVLFLLVFLYPATCESSVFFSFPILSTHNPTWINRVFLEKNV